MQISPEEKKIDVRYQISERQVGVAFLLAPERVCEPERAPPVVSKKTWRWGHMQRTKFPAPGRWEGGGVRVSGRGSGYIPSAAAARNCMFYCTCPVPAATPIFRCQRMMGCVVQTGGGRIGKSTLAIELPSPPLQPLQPLQPTHTSNPPTPTAHQPCLGPAYPALLRGNVIVARQVERALHFVCVRARARSRQRSWIESAGSRS